MRGVDSKVQICQVWVWNPGLSAGSWLSLHEPFTPRLNLKAPRFPAGGLFACFFLLGAWSRFGKDTLLPSPVVIVPTYTVTLCHQSYFVLSEPLPVRILSVKNMDGKGVLTPGQSHVVPKKITNL